MVGGGARRVARAACTNTRRQLLLVLDRR